MSNWSCSFILLYTQYIISFGYILSLTHKKILTHKKMFQPVRHINLVGIMWQCSQSETLTLTYHPSCMEQTGRTTNVREEPRPPSPPTPRLFLDDLERWSDSGKYVPCSSTRWQFETYPHNNATRLSIISTSRHKQHSYLMHNQLALMLGYLDLDYWLTNIKPTSTWNQNRIAAYLLNLHVDVVQELMGLKSDVLLQTTFGTQTLRGWAVRVHHEHGHSKSGRRRYEEACDALRMKPYITEDFINYGESNIP